MFIDKLSDGEVLRAHEAFYFDLLSLLVQTDKDLVIVSKSTINQVCFDVVFVIKELVQLCQFVILAHQEVALVGKSLLLFKLFLSQLGLFWAELFASFRMLSCQFIEYQLSVKFRPDLSTKSSDFIPSMSNLLHG